MCQGTRWRSDAWSGICQSELIYEKSSGEVTLAIGDADVSTLLGTTHVEAFHVVWRTHPNAGFVPAARSEKPDVPGLVTMDLDVEGTLRDSAPWSHAAAIAVVHPPTLLRWWQRVAEWESDADGDPDAPHPTSGLVQRPARRGAARFPGGKPRRMGGPAGPLSAMRCRSKSGNK